MRNGFTLIELLVVVLIIGILASVALPQYKKAVYKSKYATLKNLVRALANAEEVYYMANGSYTDQLDELVIDLPFKDDPRNTPSKKYYTNDSYCYVDLPSFSTVGCEDSSINMSLQLRLDFSLGGRAGHFICYARGSTSSDTVQAQICKAETRRTSPSVVGPNHTSWQYD